MSEDDFKGWFHAGVGVLMGVMLGYNVMRLCSTRQRRNAVNAVLYAPLMLYELRQAQHHFAASGGTRA